ncbi:hypothetical protein GAMM_40308 [Gammaproteobacteria bacterium]
MIPNTKSQKIIETSKEDFSTEQEKAIAYVKQIRAINSANEIFKKRAKNSLNRDKYYSFLAEADEVDLEKLKKLQNNDANEVDNIWSIFNILEKTLALKKEEGLEFNEDGIATISVEVQGRFLEVTIKKDPNSGIIPGTNNTPEEFKIIGLSQYWWEKEWNEAKNAYVRPDWPNANRHIIELNKDQPIEVKIKDGLISAYSHETKVEIIKDQFIDRNYQADLMLKTVGLEMTKEGLIKKTEEEPSETQLIVAGTGVGKTGVILTTALMYEDGIFAVPSDALVDQMCKDANDFIKDKDKSKNPLTVKLPKNIEDVDVEKFLKSHKYVVMTHEQLIKYAKVIKNRHVFIDEAHTLVPRSFEKENKRNVSEALDSIENNNITLYTTATPTSELEARAVKIEDFSLYRTQHEEKMVRPVATEDSLKNSEDLSKTAVENLLMRETEIKPEMKGYSNTELEKNYRLASQVQGLIFTDDPIIAQEIYENLSHDNLAQLNNNDKAINSKKAAIRENISAIKKIETDIGKNTQQLLKESNKNPNTDDPDLRREASKIKQLNVDIERLNRRKEAVTAEMANLTDNTLEENIVEAQKKIIECNIKIDIIVSLNTSLLTREELEKLARNKKYEDLDAEYTSSFNKYKEKKNNWKLSQVLMKNPSFEHFYEKNLQSEIDKKLKEQITCENLSGCTVSNMARSGVQFSLKNDSAAVYNALSKYVKALRTNSGIEKAKEKLIATFRWDFKEAKEHDTDIRIRKMCGYYTNTEEKVIKEFRDLAKKGDFDKLITEERKIYNNQLIATEIREATSTLEKHLQTPKIEPVPNIKNDYEESVIQYEKNQEKLKELRKNEEAIKLIHQSLTEEIECENNLKSTEEKITKLQAAQQEVSGTIAKLELIKTLSKPQSETFLKQHNKELEAGISQIHTSEKQNYDEKLKEAVDKKTACEKKIAECDAKYEEHEKEENTKYENSIKDYKEIVNSLLKKYDLNSLCNKDTQALQKILSLQKLIPLTTFNAGPKAITKWISNVLASAKAMRDHPDQCALRENEHNIERKGYEKNLEEINNSIDLLEKKHTESENNFSKLKEKITAGENEEIEALAKAAIPGKKINLKIQEYEEKLVSHKKELTELEKTRKNTEITLSNLKEQTLKEKKSLEQKELSGEHKEKVKTILENEKTSSKKNEEITAILIEIEKTKKTVDLPHPDEQIIIDYDKKTAEFKAYQEKSEEYKKKLEELKNQKDLDVGKISALVGNEEQYVKLKEITEILTEIKTIEEKLKEERKQAPPDDASIKEYEKQSLEKRIKFEQKRKKYQEVKSELAPNVEEIDTLLRDDEKYAELVKIGKEIPIANFEYENEKEESPVLINYYSAVVNYYNKELELTKNEGAQKTIRESEEKIRKAKETLTTHDKLLQPTDIQQLQQTINDEQKNIDKIRESIVKSQQKEIINGLQKENRASELLLLEKPKVVEGDTPEQAKAREEEAAKTNNLREQIVKALLKKGLRMFVISDGLLGTGYSNPNLQNTVLVQNKSIRDSPPDINLIIKCIQQYGRAIRSEEGISFIASVINKNLPKEEQILTSEETFGKDATSIYIKKLINIDQYYLDNLNGLSSELDKLKKLQPKLEGNGELKALSDEFLTEINDKLTNFAIIPGTEVEAFLKELTSFNQRIEDQYYVDGEIKKHLSTIELFMSTIEPKRKKIEDALKPEVKKAVELNKLADEITTLKKEVTEKFEVQLEELRKLLQPRFGGEVKAKINDTINQVALMQKEQLGILDELLAKERALEDNKIKELANATKDAIENKPKKAENEKDLTAIELDELVIKIQDSEKKISDLQKQRKEFEGTRKIEARAADMRQLIEEVDGLEQKALLEMHNEQIRLAELAKTIRLKDKDVKAEIEKHLSAIKLFIEKNIEPKIQEIKDTLKSGIKNVIELNKLAGEIKALGETVNKNFNDQLEGLRKLLVPLNLDAGVRTSVEAAIENVKNMQTEQLKALDSGEKDLRELAKAQGIEDQRVMDLIAANNKVVDPI